MDYYYYLLIGKLFYCESFNNCEVYKKKSFNNYVFFCNIEIYFFVKGWMKIKKERKVI